MAVFVVLRVYPFIGARTGRGIDSFDYRAAARLPLFSREFLAGARPFGYPLYLKLVRHHERVAVVGQLVIDTLAWLALALMVARATTNRRLAWAGASIVLGLGATYEAIEWDRIIGSEALSTACGVGLLAALLWLRERWTIPRLVVVAMLAAAATALRDSNGTFLGLVGLLLLVAVLVRRVPRRVAVLGLVFVAIAALGSTSASVGRRWEGPLKDVITLRVLTSPERTAYFQHAGMPLTRARDRPGAGTLRRAHGRLELRRHRQSCLLHVGTRSRPRHLPEVAREVPGNHAVGTRRAPT